MRPLVDARPLVEARLSDPELSAETLAADAGLSYQQLYRALMEELDTTPGARRHTSFGTGTFQPCNHPYRPGRVNRVNFYTCENSPASSDSVQRSNLMMFNPPTDPIWIDCAAGCCIVK